MEIKLLAKNTGYLAAPKVLKFIIGVFRAKLIAIFLGPVGAGVIAQLRNIIQNISRFTLSGMNDGMVKLIARENSLSSDNARIASIIKTYAFTIIPITFLVIFFGYFFSANITKFVFGNLEYKLYFQIGFIALPISILSSSAFALLKSYKEIKVLSISEVIIIVINFLIFLPLIYFFQLLGAVIYISISFLTTFFVYEYFSRKRILQKLGLTFNAIKNSGFKFKYFKELMAFMGFGLSAGVYEIFTDLTTRSIVANKLGVGKIGIYSPIVAWSGLFTGFILPSLTTYLFPRIAEAKTDREIVGVVNDVIRLMTFITVPFILIGITTRSWLIPIFYSKDFMEASIYLPFHFAALIFTPINFAFAQIFAPTGRLKYFLPIVIFNNTFNLALVYFLTPKYGLYGWMARFTITPLIASLIYFGFWYFKIKFRFNKENILMLIVSIFVLLFYILLRNELAILSIALPFSFVLLWFMLLSEEKRFIVKKATGFLGRKKG